MKLIYKGKFSGNPDDIPHGEHMPGAVRFKEPTNVKRFAIIINIVAAIISLIMIITVRIIADINLSDNKQFIWMMLGFAASMLALFPHELLHAVCFKETVYLYTNLKQGMLFVTGPETMSKSRFIFMSMLPNLVFGFIPFIIFLIFPKLVFFGALGALSIGCGAGDYMNVINALVQMPKGAKTYIYSFNSYWYMPLDEKR